MKIIAVDDERIALEGLLDVISEAAPDAQLNGFEYPEDALDFVDEIDCQDLFRGKNSRERILIFEIGEYN